MKRLIFLLICLTFTITGWSQLSILPYSTGKWNADTLGNQRVIIRVDQSATAVCCDIPWRRKDLNPLDKELLIYSQKDHRLVTNVIRKEINRESGTVIFEPIAGAGIYELYYLPFKSSGGNYPKVNYLKPVDRCNPDWKAKCMNQVWPKAVATEMQSINALHSFYPMEVIASRKETDQLLSKFKGSAMALFPEYREYPIKMWNDVPYRWIKRGRVNTLADSVHPGEYYSFQVGVFALKDSLTDVKVKFSDWVSADGSKIPASAMTCFNMGGNDWNQKPLTRQVNIKQGTIQPLWLGIDVSKDVAPGVYHGTVEITKKGDRRPETEKRRLETGERRK